MTRSIERLSLGDVLTRQGAAWDRLDGGEASPFAGRDWLDAWAAAAPDEEQKRVAVLAGGPEHHHQALLPLRSVRGHFRRLPVQLMSWAVGDEGSPDYMDFPAGSSVSLE